MSAPIPVFSDRPKAAPTPKLRALVKYPGNILGGTGIDVTKQSGTVTIDMQWNEFGLQSAIPTSPTNNILTFDTATNQYVMIPSSLLGGAVAGIADAPNNGTQYGRQSGAWTSIPPAGIGDAPSDGIQYGRKNAAWSPVSSTNFLQDGTGAVTRTFQDKDRDWVSAKDYGARGDGSTNDTAALQAWLNFIVTNHKQGYLPAGTYNFSSPLTMIGSDFAIVGAGHGSILQYTGASTTPDLIVVGDGTTAILHATFKDFWIVSATKMTAGAGLRLRNTFLCHVDGVIFGDDNFSPVLNLYVGVWWDHFQYGSHINSNLQSSSVFFQCNDGADLVLDNIKMLGGPVTTAGLEIGGGSGGIYLGYVSIYGHQNGVIVSNRLSALGNNQIFVSNRAVVDTCANAGWYINDNVASNKSFIMGGWAASTQSAGGHGFLLLNWAEGTVSFTGAQIVSNINNGITILDTSATVLIDPSTVILHNGTGITGAATNNLFCDAFPIANGVAFGPNYRAGSGAFNAPWSSFASTVSAGGGTPTASATIHYAIRGKSVKFVVNIAITSNNGGAGALLISLPAVLVGMSGMAHGRQTNQTGKTVTGTVNGSTMDIVYYDNTYPGSDGGALRLAGTFELP